MLGGYTVVTAVNAGINVWVASLVLAPLIVGAFGLVIERTIIRFLYGRMIDTMLATWGLSLALVRRRHRWFSQYHERRFYAARFDAVRQIRASAIIISRSSGSQR